MPSIFTLQGPTFGYAGAFSAPSKGGMQSVLVLGSDQTLGYDFYLQPEFDATDTCDLPIPGGTTAPVPCDLQPGPRAASAKEKSQWNAALNLAAAMAGPYVGNPGAYAAVKAGKLDFKRYRDATNTLVGKFYDGSILLIKPIAGGFLDSSLKWAHDNLCLLVGGGAGAGSANASVAIKAKAACDALQAMNAGSGPGPGDNAGFQSNKMSTGTKIAIGGGVAVGLAGIGLLVAKLLK